MSKVYAIIQSVKYEGESLKGICDNIDDALIVSSKLILENTQDDVHYFVKPFELNALVAPITLNDIQDDVDDMEQFAMSKIKDEG